MACQKNHQPGLYYRDFGGTVVFFYSFFILVLKFANSFFFPGQIFLSIIIHLGVWTLGKQSCSKNNALELMICWSFELEINMIWHVFFLLAWLCYPFKPILEFPDLLPSGAVWVAIATRTTSWVLFGPAQLLPSGAESEHFLWALSPCCYPLGWAL